MSYPISQLSSASQPGTRSIASSSTSPQPSSANPPQVHKRTYQACIPCRQRKVRCDLGSVEAPHSPPCVRCRRESKDCFFSATRRKTRTNSTNVIPRGGAKAVSTASRGGAYMGSTSVTKREYGDDGAYDIGEDRGDADSICTETLLPHGVVRKKQKVAEEEDSFMDAPYRRPSLVVAPHLDSQYLHPPPQPETHHHQQAASASRRLLQGEVYNSHDALHLLYEAAGRDASGPPSPSKPKSDSGDNMDDEEEDLGEEDEDNDHHNSTMVTPQNNDLVRPAMTSTHPEPSSYSNKYENVDGRPSIDPIGHFNGSISTSTSFLRGTGRPVAKSPSQMETAQHLDSSARTASSSAAVNTPISPVNARQNYTQQSSQLSHSRNRSSFSQRSTTSDKSSNLGGGDEGLQAALKAWGRSRFVKSGWFTAREAIRYIDYFFEHHHPLSPLLTTSYEQHSTHPTLLQHEPFLATTLLAIASRYVNLPGPGGHSRSYAIHDMLWRELRRGLESVIWGGGGGGAYNRSGLAGVSASKGKGLRTLGTVEALMVLTEWHVRNLHFPVGGEGGWGAFDGVFGNDPEEEEHETTNENFITHRRHRSSIAGRRARERHRGVVEGLGDRIENILEPAWRSDRMSWMLLGNALTLSYELGVFNDLDEPISSVSTPQSAATPSSSHHPQTATQCPPSSTPLSPALAYRLRCRKIQKLLIVYVTQLASRLGWTSMIPKTVTDSLGYKEQSSSESRLAAAAGEVAFPHHFVKQETGAANTTSTPSIGGTAVTNGTVVLSVPPSNTSPISTIPAAPVNGAGVRIINRPPSELQDLVFRCWVELTMLMKYCGEQCFPSRAGTRDLMRSGKYVQVLEQLRPILLEWKDAFEAFGFPKPIHNIMTLEYEHVRMYINSLALQTIIDRCTTASLYPASKKSKSSSNSTAPEQPSFSALMQTYSGDLTFINEVVDASRCVLTTVVERMAPTGELKHAPVRIYLRILSAAMFLLKTFALGAKEDEFTVSLELMDQTVEVLRRESCDDVHLGLRFGELLETLTKRVRMRFVRMAGSRADSPAPEGGKPKCSSGGRGIGSVGLMTASSVLQSAVSTGEVVVEGEAASQFSGGGSVPPGNLGGVSVDGEGGVRPMQDGTHNAGTHNAGTPSDGTSNLLSSALMPPPPPVYQYFADFNTDFEDWLALPVDPIINWNSNSGDNFGGLGGVGGVGNAGSGNGGGGTGRNTSVSGYGGASSVTQTQMGPGVGEFDLLELLLGSEGPPAVKGEM